MNRALSNYFLEYNREYGDKWDSIYIPVMDIMHGGHRVRGVEINYNHPKEQTEIEENNIIFHRKRLEQLINLLNSLEAHWKKLNRT